MREPPQRSDEFQLSIPFIIDGEGYTDRDRAMFVAGYEFCQIRSLLHDMPEGGINRPIHSENVDRVRVLCGRFGRRCEIEAVDETWSQLTVEE